MQSHCPEPIQNSRCVYLSMLSTHSCAATMIILASSKHCCALDNIWSYKEAGNTLLITRLRLPKPQRAIIGNLKFVWLIE